VDKQLKLEKQTIIAVLVWIIFLILSIRVFRPDSLHVVFDSDGAIPVLMSNEARPVTLFDMYYWGVDRWGGWPLMIARVIHQDTGFQWTDYSSHVVRATWVFLGLLVLVWLNRRSALAVLVSGLIPVCLEPTLSWLLFNLSQVYAWQLTALFLAWLSLRRVLATDLLHGTGRRVLLKRIAWSVSLYLFAVLAIWSSEASAPFLGFLLLLEAARAFFLQRDDAANKWKWTRYITALLLVAGATVSHMLIKANYHRHAVKHWGGDYRATTSIDVGHLWADVQGIWRVLLEFTFKPFLIIAGLFLLVITAALVYTLLTKNRHVKERLMRVLLDDDVTMTFGLAGVALINLVMMTVLSHVRESVYNPRYLTPTFYLGSMAGVMSLYLLSRLVARRFTPYAVPVAIAAAFLFLVVRFPHFIPSPLYKRDKETALFLAQKAPGAAVMGGYWETYIFAALQQPTNTMTPLPLEGLHVRLPWTPPLLRNIREAVIEYRNNEVTKHGPLPAQIWEYGNLLKLKDPDFYQNDKYSFALYVNEP